MFIYNMQIMLSDIFVLSDTLKVNKIHEISK